MTLTSMFRLFEREAKGLGLLGEERMTMVFIACLRAVPQT
jgi:hypothetical protein